MKTKVSIPMIAAILGTLVTITSSFNPDLPKYPDAIDACTRRTGLRKGEISSYTTRYYG